MGIMVRNDFMRCAIVWKDRLDIEVGNTGSGDGLVAGDKDCGFGTVVVHYSEDAIKAVGEGEFDNEIHSNHFEGQGHGGSGDREVRGAWVSDVGFSSLAGGTTMNKGDDEVLYMGLPVTIFPLFLSYYTVTDSYRTYGLVDSPCLPSL